MNHLNYNKYISHINNNNNRHNKKFQYSKNINIDKDNKTYEFESKESDYSDYSDSDIVPIVYEETSVSLLENNYLNIKNESYIENEFEDIDLEFDNISKPHSPSILETINIDSNDKNKNNDISFNQKLRIFHNRQKDIICHTLHCSIL